MSNCSHSTCQGETCRRPVKQGINKVSKSLKARLLIYSPMAKKFIEDNPLCQIRAPDVCQGVSTCVHHTKGRIGKLLLDDRFWMASCGPCNSWVEIEDLEAREKGFKLSKFKKE